MRWRTSSGCCWTSKPQMRAAPELGFMRPVSTLMVVVLPAAFGPSSAKNSPLFTVRERSLTATSSPKRLTTWISSIIFERQEITEGVVHQDQLIGKFDLKNFADWADEHHGLDAIKKPGLESIDAHPIAANPQLIVAGLPVEGGEDVRLGAAERSGGEAERREDGRQGRPAKFLRQLFGIAEIGESEGFVG